MNNNAVQSVRAWLLGLQSRITDALQAVEDAQPGGAQFTVDAWHKEPGASLAGDGITKIL